MVHSIIVDALTGSLAANENLQEHHYSAAVGKVFANLLVLVLLALVGSNLWNTVLKRLVPAVGNARWYDVALLQVLLGLVVPN